VSGAPNHSTTVRAVGGPGGPPSGRRRTGRAASDRVVPVFDTVIWFGTVQMDRGGPVGPHVYHWDRPYSTVMGPYLHLKRPGRAGDLPGKVSF